MLPVLDDPQAADLARKRVERKPGIKERLFKRNDKQKQPERRRPSIESIDITPGPDLATGGTIKLGEGPDDDDYADEFQWAVVYENQRGMTVFSIPYYSRLSLLPSDPRPFTSPSAQSKDHQPDVSLDQYPLPDPTWEWVSKSWLIDMRSDSGDVQYDGFEYNWFFRRKNWRPHIGRLSAGAYVRRRRWIRLMRRPGKVRRAAELQAEGDNMATPISTSAPPSNRHSLASIPIPSSIATRSTEPTDSVADTELDDVWFNDDEEQNWQRYKIIIKRGLFARDGLKLDIWRKWLLDPGVYKNRIGCTLSLHGDEILESFVFPESRATFLELLNKADMSSYLQLKSRSTVDFFSYYSTSEIGPSAITL